MKGRSLFVAFALPITTLSAQAMWTVDITKPILDVRGLAADGSVNFNVPGGATRLSNGSILLADREAYAVRLFDVSGKLVKTIGRRGQGPNEFRDLYWGGGCGPGHIARLGLVDRHSIDGWSERDHRPAGSHPRWYGCPRSVRAVRMRRGRADRLCQRHHGKVEPLDSRAPVCDWPRSSSSIAKGGS